MTIGSEYMNIDKIIIRQKKLNFKLSEYLKKCGIKKLVLTSLGNSIASGYSMIRKTKPLLLRNKSIKQYMKRNNIELDIHHFARAQNNSDGHILEWLETNIKESEIHRLNRNDYSNGPTNLRTRYMTKERMEKYYPLNMKVDKGLNDVINEDDRETANIIVYNGCTGSFLDGIFRKGSLYQQMFYGVNRDTRSLDAILEKIQTNNRKNRINTQVYLCGAPNFLGINMSELINRKLKKIADKYANVVYVEPIKSKFFYKRPENEEADRKEYFFEKIFGEVDIHYDEEEYLRFNNNIIESIIDNYESTKSMIKIDRKFYEFSKNMEINDHELVNDSDNKKKIISDYFEKQYNRIHGLKRKKAFLNKMKKYLIERYPYDFYYLEKDSLIDEVSKKR